MSPVGPVRPCGHPRTPENSTPTGQCRECHRERRRRAWANRPRCIIPGCGVSATNGAYCAAHTVTTTVDKINDGISDPRWRDRAACGPGFDTLPAADQADICHGCRVADDCLFDAIHDPALSVIVNDADGHPLRAARTPAELWHLRLLVRQAAS